MNIVLFGEDVFTATVLQSLVSGKHKISAVVCPVYKTNQEYISLKHASEKNKIPFLHVDDINGHEIKTLLCETTPELIITVHLKKILHPSIYLIATKAAINVHPSLLPTYRGLSPQHQTLLNGDSITGVTIHFIDDKPDTGDIILQEEISLSYETSIFDLQIAMLSVYKYLVFKAVEQIETNQFVRVSQDENRASWFGVLRHSDREISLEKSKSEIYNLIRAVSKPYKGAFHKGVILWTSFFPDSKTERRLMYQYPDAGIYYSDDRLIMRLKDGILLSDDFQNSDF